MKTVITTQLPCELVQTLRAYCKQNEVSIVSVITEAVTQYLRLKWQPEGYIPLDSQDNTKPGGI